MSFFGDVGGFFGLTGPAKQIFNKAAPKDPILGGVIFPIFNGIGHTIIGGSKGVENIGGGLDKGLEKASEGIGKGLDKIGTGIGKGSEGLGKLGDMLGGLLENPEYLLYGGLAIAVIIVLKK
jgi:hypothetical protein